MNKELKNYIDQARKSGASDADIRQQLLINGWSVDSIDGNPFSKKYFFISALIWTVILFGVLRLYVSITDFDLGGAIGFIIIAAIFLLLLNPILFGIGGFIFDRNGYSKAATAMYGFAAAGPFFGLLYWLWNFFTS